FLLSSAYRQVRFDTIAQNKQIATELAALREKYRKLVWEALAETIRPVADQLSENLLAARTAIRAGKGGETAEVRAWVKYLAFAATDTTDPFHVWATLAPLKDDEAEEKLAVIVREYRRQIKKPSRTILEREFEFGRDSQFVEACVIDEPLCWGT